MMKWKNKVKEGLIDIIELDNHKVRVYENRLAIWRKDGSVLTWDELNEVKECIWGNQFAIELYPKQDEVINIKNTRHLWKLDKETEMIITKKCSHIEFMKVVN